jgi:hypothetical protein
VKKILIAILLISFYIPLNAQKTIDGLIGAEKAFAQYALDKNITGLFKIC